MEIAGATQHETIDMGHGRIEERRIVACPMPKMPGWETVKQCFAITRTRIIKKSGITTTETVYGITSLASENANAQCLLQLNRKHWGIENRLHRTRDVTFREDASTLRKKSAPQANAALNNIALEKLAKIHKSTTIAIEICQYNIKKLFKSLDC